MAAWLPPHVAPASTAGVSASTDRLSHAAAAGPPQAYSEALEARTVMAQQLICLAANPTLSSSGPNDYCHRMDRGAK